MKPLRGQGIHRREEMAGNGGCHTVVGDSAESHDTCRDRNQIVAGRTIGGEKRTARNGGQSTLLFGAECPGGKCSTFQVKGRL